jgi:hypothetical protein
MAVRRASKSLPESGLALRAIAMPVFPSPSDAEGSGRHCRSHFDELSAPSLRQRRGELLCEILKVGRSSITVRVEAFARRGRRGKQIQVTAGVFTSVAVDAVDSESKPRPV